MNSLHPGGPNALDLTRKYEFFRLRDTPAFPFEELDSISRDLINSNVPGFESALPDRAINTLKIRALLQCFAEDVLKVPRADLLKAKKLNEDNEKVYRALLATYEATLIQLQEARADFHAAREGRGTYENTRLTELTASNEAKQREIATLTEARAKLTIEVSQLKNELTTASIAHDATRREKSDLLGAAVLTAKQMQEAAVLLADARSMLAERYGDSNPFATVIVEQLDTVRGMLPKSLAK